MEKVVTPAIRFNVIAILQYWAIRQMAAFSCERWNKSHVSLEVYPFCNLTFYLPSDVGDGLCILVASNYGSL